MLISRGAPRRGAQTTGSVPAGSSGRWSAVGVTSAPVGTKGHGVLAARLPRPAPRRRQGGAAKKWGFDGLPLADSDNLVGDPYVELALAARKTQRLLLGPAVTSPVTGIRTSPHRHRDAADRIGPSGRDRPRPGRLYGPAAGPAARHHRAARAGPEPAAGPLPRADRSLPAGGVVARMGWIEPFQAGDVSVSVAAPGPVTIALAARRRGRVELSVGADPRWVSWAVTEARRAVQDTGTPLSLGAFVNIAVHSDVAVARDLVRGSAAIFVHFVSGSPHDMVPDDDRAVVER